jgi:Protein implicated in ribosomal biogenesis, Nop56p homolog
MSENEPPIQFSTWFGKVSFSPESGFSAEHKTPTELDVSFLADELISASASALNIRSVSSLKNYLQSEKPDYRELEADSNLFSSASDSEYVSYLRDVSIQAVRKQLSACMTEDKKVIQAVEALDDLNETINHLTERLTEWYSAYYPELDLPGEAYVRFVSEIPESASQSRMGAPATDEDLRLLQSFAEDILSLYERKSAVESFIFDKMKQTAPNVSQIAGVVLGARLLSMAGGLKNLANMPSGSIQVMGAEKAMVKHLRSNAPSPKHGIIFSHPILNTSPLRARGKISRTFSASISLAARTDYYSGEFKPEIESGLNSKVRNILKSDQKEASK